MGDNCKKCHTLDPQKSWLCNEQCDKESSARDEKSSDSKTFQMDFSKLWNNGDRIVTVEDEPSTQDETTGDPGRRVSEEMTQEETSEKVELCQHHHAHLAMRMNYSEERSDDSDDPEG